MIPRLASRVNESSPHRQLSRGESLGMGTEEPLLDEIMLTAGESVQHIDNDHDVSAYHSDSILSAAGQRERLLRAQRVTESAVDGGKRRASTVSYLSERRSVLRAGKGARDKQTRRKNIARRAREEEEIRLFRGRVSTVCTCMEIDIEQLFSFLQKDLHDGVYSQQHEKQAGRQPGRQGALSSDRDRAKGLSSRHPSSESLVKVGARKARTRASHEEAKVGDSGGSIEEPGGAREGLWQGGLEEAGTGKEEEAVRSISALSR